eukprot:gene13751-13870_t
MGSDASGGLWVDPNHRGDITSWVSLPELANQPLLAAVVRLLQSVRGQLSQHGFDVSGRSSVQLACYPGAGAHYVRHTDASAAVPGRCVTALLYLNTDWHSQDDGGELALYNTAYARQGNVAGLPCSSSSGSSFSAAAPAGPAQGYLAGEPALLISPIAGRLLLFDSRISHEDDGPGDAGSAAVAAPVSSPGDTSAVEHHLGAAKALTASASSSSSSHQTIFVSIAAFRDEECQWTLRDMFLKAAHPDRVTAGVVWQVDPEGDAAFVRMAGGQKTADFQPQELCAAQAASGNKRAVLSTYPGPYSGQGPAAVLPDDPPRTLLCATHFDSSGLLRIKSRTLCQAPAGPMVSLFWAAGFSFAPSSWLLEVPYCPHLPHLFFGEELYMLARMWTRGWDVWAPSQAVVFHQWKRSARPNSYQAQVKVDVRARAESEARIMKLLQHTPACVLEVKHDKGSSACESSLQRHPGQQPSESSWLPGGIWGLGLCRTLQDFEQFCDVQFAKGVIGKRALLGGQPSPHAFVG